ncbi:hypothetical protein ACUV84_022743 [Puccinellia chinampoensis]
MELGSTGSSIETSSVAMAGADAPSILSPAFELSSRGAIHGRAHLSPFPILCSCAHLQDALPQAKKHAGDAFSRGGEKLRREAAMDLRSVCIRGSPELLVQPRRNCLCGRSS